MLPGFNGQLENEVLALVDELLRVHPHLLRQVSELENKTSKLMRGGGGCQRGSLSEKSRAQAQMPSARLPREPAISGFHNPYLKYYCRYKAIS